MKINKLLFNGILSIFVTTIYPQPSAQVQKLFAAVEKTFEQIQNDPQVKKYTEAHQSQRKLVGNYYDKQKNAIMEGNPEQANKIEVGLTQARNVLIQINDQLSLAKNAITQKLIPQFEVYAQQMADLWPAIKNYIEECIKKDPNFDNIDCRKTLGFWQKILELTDNRQLLRYYKEWVLSINPATASRQGPQDKILKKSLKYN